MMQEIETTEASPAPTEPSWAEVNIALELPDGSYLLDDGRLALQSLSCLVKPCIGDRVLVTACKQGDNYILHVLTRSRGDGARISLPGIRQLTIAQAQIDLLASAGIGLSTLGDIDISAASGILRLSACNLFTSVSENQVENIQHYIGQVEQYLLDVKSVLYMHGKQASITAEHDVKIDAERISLG